MIKILKHLGKSAIWIPIIVILLIIQAYCDLTLPQYTSDIVDIGIQQGGIKSAAIETIRDESFQKLMLFDKNNLLAKYYSNEGNGEYSLVSENAEEVISYPAAVVYTLDNIDLTQIDGVPTLPKGMTLTDALLAMPDEQRVPVIEQINAGFETYSDIMLGISFIIMILTIVVGFLAAQLGSLFGMNVREKIFKKVISFSNSEMDKFSTASLITRSTNDIMQVQMIVVMILRMVLYAPIMGIGGIIKVINTGTGMGWIIVVAVAAIMSLVLILMSVAMPKFKIMQKLVDRLNLVTREILTGLQVIRAFSREEYEEDRFDKANSDLMKTQLFTNRVMTIMMTFMTLIMNGISVLIIWFGAKGIDSGNMQVGDMMAFLTYSMQIVMSFLMLTMISIMLPRAAVSAGRINEVLESEPSVTDKENAAEKGITTGKVVFDNVSFSYGDSEEKVLHDITFTAEAGETTAIIGSTGSGKTNLINLIPRFFDVTEGKVTIDGIDVRDFTQHYLRENIGLVPQKGVLFSGTIFSNLSFGIEDATAEQLVEATEIAQARSFIEEKEEKFESPIAQGGTNVSGGQKQRLSIARAIVKKPKIYIFDDSFSALDYKTDAALRKALHEKVADSTVIIVAQRISTILNADKIIVLDEGKIAGIGRHEELLENCEIYNQIASSQLSESELKQGRKEAE